ncbi:MAG: hypothetical protein B7Y25_00055 [Alphaproteobacteria bacterium 16-39-46]|nr:MAG: hypothetical protein B7Y25_00055 [Alphaproteobacteria bacterium 16-39-46]OZA44550.1 MAG: hypothetical protein B7X84_00265 [Alphaproteobacteria bacterium 17-39-52]HQS83399.1 PDDEXK nuclease domain-containing protein [Alphaproteobacteria bacterium]HQS93086.1 PDDEXK nuclease domain-containing protein [Alphaproteobacteria bacterium]
MIDRKEVSRSLNEKQGNYLDKSYALLLNEIKSRLKSAQLKAAITINHELLKFYWDVGILIIEQQEKAKWGDKLYDKLSRDLSLSFPSTKGFSKTNLKNMRNFASHYPQGEFSQSLPDQLSWTQHVILLQMVDVSDFHKKQWYALKTIEAGWGYRELRDQIKSDLYERQADKSIKTTNFHEKLPSPTSHLAQEMIKEPYKFHFLTVGEDAYEKEIHNGLVNHVKQFLMELGQGFALYGTKFPITVSSKRFEIDLLMYNTKLHCYVVIELKRGDFQPQHTGQLNFYLSAIDDQIKTPEDGPTIGLLLCEKKDKVIAEYALRRVESPMGISEYELSKSLPSRLHSILPTTDEIEAELNEFTEKETDEEDNL